MAQDKKRGRLILLFLLFFLSGCSLSPEGEVISTGQSDPEGTEAFYGEGDSQEDMIFVYVCGQVKHPGVYSFKAGSRVYEAIEAAGGFTKDANQESLNLAEALEDESKILVSSKTDENKGEKDKADGESDGKLNLNQASKEELMNLPGIGEKRAEAILKLRKQKGSFQKIEDLLEAEGIKEGIFQKIKDLIKV